MTTSQRSNDTKPTGSRFVRFSEVPLADWIPRQGKDSHDALTKLTDEINQQLGRRSVNSAGDDSQQSALNVDHC